MRKWKMRPPADDEHCYTIDFSGETPLTTTAAPPFQTREDTFAGLSFESRRLETRLDVLCLL